LIRGILRAEEDAGPAKSNGARERGGILHAEDFESLIRKFGKAGDLWYVYHIKIKNMPLDINSETFLTGAQVRAKAPSIFTTQGSPETSDRYAHIQTDRILSDMELLGWGVVDAKEVKARKGIGFQKHLVVFRNPDLMISAEDGDDVFPQILLTNSHDGKNAFTFTAGLFRMVCENGLVISTTEFESMKIRHYGYSFEELQTTIRAMVERLPLTVESLNKFRAVELGQDQMLEFAQRALSARFSEDELGNIEVDLAQLLEPTRAEDRGSDLWSVFNVVQEKLVGGMFNYTYGNKVRKARRIKNFKQDIVVNEKLYDLALSYAQVAA
jgi:hypothetical protein